MKLAAGARIEQYEIVAAIGAGGMGEVYRARDTRLGRSVAFKVLPEQFIGHSDRLARFEREAQVLASLNHPNIAHIYDVVDSPQTPGIVMELVEGETLHDRLRRGQLSVSEAVFIARQIADALEAAHDRGIVHRDLKPNNIMLTGEGRDARVKVLDFGLARVVEPLSADVTNSPTVVTATHAPGAVLLGTAAYMAPEQARGQTADERSDVWAFGCVLYEMLAGRSAFSGDTLTDLLGGIVHVDPDWKALPGSAPSALGALIKGCLEKERRRRIHAIGDVRLELERIAAGGSAPIAGPGRRERLAWGIAASFALIAIGGVVAWRYLTPSPPPPVTARFDLQLGEVFLAPFDAAPLPTVSPDGRFIVFVAGGAGAPSLRLWLRPMGALTAQPITGTEGIVGSDITKAPFWSPDSRFVAFFRAGKLEKIAIGGGPPQQLTDTATSGGATGTWNRDDVILFEGQGAIHRVAAGGGVSAAVRTPDKSKNEAAFRFPSFLPDGDHFVYVAIGSEAGRTEVRVGSLSSDADTALFPTAPSRVVYSPPGYLLFARSGTLMAQPFDADRRSLTGDLFPVAQQVGQATAGPATGAAAFDASSTGTLVYRVAGATIPTDLTWFDRTGRKLSSVPVTGNFINPILSPDQTRVAVERIDGGNRDIWIIDLVRGTSSRFTFDPATEQYPVFSPDGQQVLFVSDRKGAISLYGKAANGIGEEKLLIEAATGVTDWSGAAKTVLYAVGNPFKIWAWPQDTGSKPFPVVNDQFTYIRAKFSPDGKWFAYTSNESGRNEVFVQTFPPSGGKWQVSIDGGEYVYWRRDGRELIFGTSDRKIYAVDVKLGSTFEAGVPRRLFDLPGTMAGVRFAPSVDAQRFLVPLLSETVRPSLTVVSNWTADIK